MFKYMNININIFFSCRYIRLFLHAAEAAFVAALIILLASKRTCAIRFMTFTSSKLTS